MKTLFKEFSKVFFTVINFLATIMCMIFAAFLMFFMHIQFISKVLSLGSDKAPDQTPENGSVEKALREYQSISKSSI